jgi:hypothetical protein
MTVEVLNWLAADTLMQTTKNSKHQIIKKTFPSKSFVHHNTYLGNIPAGAWVVLQVKDEAILLRNAGGKKFLGDVCNIPQQAFETKYYSVNSLLRLYLEEDEELTVMDRLEQQSLLLDEPAEKDASEQEVFFRDVCLYTKQYIYHQPDAK